MDSKIDPAEPAFPGHYDHLRPNEHLAPGVSNREYFAGLAMLGFITRGESNENAASLAWDMADRMLEQGAKIPSISPVADDAERR